MYLFCISCKQIDATIKVPTLVFNLAYPTLTKRTALLAGRLRVRFPPGSTGIFYSLNPSGRPVALGSTQPLIEMSASSLMGKGGRC